MKTLYLSKKSDFNLLKVRGIKRRLPFGTVVYANSSDECARLGFAISRKVGSAVLRNKMKRRIRVAFRNAMKESPKNMHVLVIANKTSLQHSIKQLQEELWRAIR